MAARTIVVIVQPSDGVEKQQPSEVNELVIDTAPNSLFQRGINPAREALLREDSGQLLIQCCAAISGGWRSQRKQSASYETYQKSGKFCRKHIHWNSS
ncbi:MAG: hypothetical protein ACRD2L_10480 [Terriglobia bacterium]